MRELIHRSTLEAMESQRITRRYGVVQSIDSVSKTVQVLFPENSTSVTVRYGFARPGEVGQQVRVEGESGDLWIAEVLGYVIYTGIPAAQLLAVDLLDVAEGLNALIAIWDHNLGYPEYKVEWAEDFHFTVGVESIVTNHRESHNIPGLDPQKSYYVRLYAGNGDGDFGPAGTKSGPHSPLDIFYSDGSPPASSPAVTLDAGIRMLAARWTPVVNADPVFYEVHASTTSGFTPDGTTLLTDTTLSSHIFTRMPDGSPVPTDGTTVYVRVVAFDLDGSAAAGAQGSAAAGLVELGDVGNVPYNAITDGLVPSGTAPTPTLTSGPGYLFAKWDHGTNDDQLTYEVHVHTTNDFTPLGGGNTMVLETTSNFAFIRNQSAAIGGGPLNYAVTYYVKIVMKDLDGECPNYSVQDSANVPRVETTDIEPLHITTALIADAAVGTLQVDDAAITDAKIGTVSADKLFVGTGYLDTAVINDGSIAAAKIANASITSAQIDTLAASDITTGTFAADRIGAGTIDAQTIILSNSASSILKAATGQWEIKGDGSATFANITITGGSMTGGAITGGSISIGTGNDSFHVNTTGQMWVGNTAYASSPFKVDNNGDVITNDLTVNGTASISATTTLDGTLTVGGFGSGGLFQTAVEGNQGVRIGSILGATPSIHLGNGGVLDGRIYGIQTGSDSASLRLESPEWIDVGQPYFTYQIMQPQRVAFGHNIFGIGYPFFDYTLGLDEFLLEPFAADDFRVTTTSGGDVYVNSNGLVDITSAANNITLDSDGVYIGSNMILFGNAANPTIRATTGNLTFQVDNGGLVNVFRGTSAGAAQAQMTNAAGTYNVTADGTGSLQTLKVTTSSLRWKEDVTHLDSADSMEIVRSLTPIRYKSTLEADEELPHQWSFAAEEAAVIAEELIGRDEDGIPLGLNQRSFLVQVWNAVRNLDERLTGLEG
ncbi:MAG: hypothetical protein HKN37_12935 [Rhodothermales bacterium]|nr:hypothetical protein [Rhodothermales bacterium]